MISTESFVPLGLLQSSANSIVTARGMDRIAADHGHLFHYDDVGAEFVSLNGGGQASPPAPITATSTVMSSAAPAVPKQAITAAATRIFFMLDISFFVFAGRLLAIPRTPMGSNPGEDTRDSKVILTQAQ